jgi:transposase
LPIKWRGFLPSVVEYEVNESYFVGIRKGKGERGAVEKVFVFGLLKRGCRVFPAMMPNTRTALSHITERMIHQERSAERQSAIDWIENSWNQAKGYLIGFNGGM